jgi:GNAT superfamily N-acetyltransferase
VSDDLARALTFERSLHRRMSTRFERFAWGTAFLDDRYPTRWDSNFLWVERSVEDVSGEALAAEADRVLGSAGLPHREIVIDDEAEGARLAGELAGRGYEVSHLTTMARRREADRPGGWATEEVDARTLRPALETVLRREPWGDDEVTVRMLADYRRVLALTIDARFFVARVEDEIVSMCELYVDPPVAQIDDVATLSEFRGRGLARAVVLRAVEEARAADCDLVFLNAFADDWPRRLYARLGFDPIGGFWSLVRPPGRALGSPA